MILSTELYQQMAEGSVIITPNNRLAKQILNDFLAHQDSIVVEKPQCLPYQAFLQARFKWVLHHYPHHQHPTLLSTQQKHHLWRKILKAEHAYDCHDGLLQKIDEAWIRCQQWCIDIADPSFAETKQTRQFQHWALQLTEKVKHLNTITLEQLPTYLQRFPNAFQLNKVYWLCFDDDTPEQQAIKVMLNDQGCIQLEEDLSVPNQHITQYAAKDTDDEHEQLIVWLKERIHLGEPQIAVVVPELQKHSHTLQRLLEEHFTSLQFNVSLGQPLGQYPLIAHALQFINLDANKTLTPKETHLLLQSPYLLGAKTEWFARSQAMQDETFSADAKMTLARITALMQAKTPILADILTAIRPYPEKATVEEWMECFKARLQKLGFPGEYAFDSENYQCLQRFFAVFDEFLQLSLITPVMTQAQALQESTYLIQSTIFKPKKADCPIQILGLLEAAGCTFDSLWVCGLTDQCLPKKTNLSAFIPVPLQQERDMPHARPERELRFAEKTIERLCTGARYVVLSYPRWVGDMPNLPSPVIYHLPFKEAVNVIPPLEQSALQFVEEDYFVGLLEHEKITGGASILARQASCPFQAFATHRLYAATATQVTQGLSPAERGSVIHQIMDMLWQELKNQEQLLALDDRELSALIQKTIQKVLLPWCERRAYSFPQLVYEVECLRIERIVLDALNWEKQRLPFKVASLEQSFQIEIGGLGFKVRVDRIDELDNGEQWVIDYKSTLPTVKPWFDERPEAPQLLLYALLNEHIRGLLFLQLKTGQLLCSGVNENKSSLKGMTHLPSEKSWEEQRTQWHDVLSGLAKEFKEGHCPPTPVQSSSCQQCDFKNLCRIES